MLSKLLITPTYSLVLSAPLRTGSRSSTSARSGRSIDPFITSTSSGWSDLDRYSE